MKPGEIITCQGETHIIANENLETVLIRSIVEIGPFSWYHIHFFEVNRALEFDRKAARGFRLNVPAGTAARFEPGDSRKSNWWPLPDPASLWFNNFTNGAVDL